MPELPEVETIRRGLENRLIGLKIQQISVLCEKSFIGNPDRILGHKVTALRRFGKALIIDLDDNLSLMVHLRMTGQLIFDGKPSNNHKTTKPSTVDSTTDSIELTANRFAAGHPSENFVASLPNQQTRVVIKFDAGTLYFNDQRKFGFIKLITTDQVEEDSFIKKLAKEPWQMTPEEFYEKLQKHQNSLIKAVILDQSVIAGLGNIYADESLFMSHVHPERRAGSLTRAEATKLLESAREVMTRSIESGGSTMATYVRADGSRGNYLEKFAQVFRREGQPCPKCGTEIIKTRVAGRGTHICPKCQPAPKDIKAKPTKKTKFADKSNAKTNSAPKGSHD